MLLVEGPDAVNEHVAAGIDAAPGILTGDVLNVAALPLVRGEEHLGAESFFELRLEPADLVASSLVGGILDATTGQGLDACRIEIDEDRHFGHEEYPVYFSPTTPASVTYGLPTSCASTTATAATCTMSLTSLPRCNTWTGWLKPVNSGPISSAPPMRWSSL